MNDAYMSVATVGVSTDARVPRDGRLSLLQTTATCDAVNVPLVLDVDSQMCSKRNADD